MSTSAGLQIAASKPVTGAIANLALQRKCACGSSASELTGECEGCRREKAVGLQANMAVGARGGGLSRNAPLNSRTAAPVNGAAAARTIAAEALQSPGTPLDASTRRFFETRFGHDFGDVRIHADARAAASAHALDAQAYTSGRDIAFARGRYDVTSASGQRLLAHELTHVVQQRSGLAAAGVSATNDPAEREAERNAERLQTGEVLRFAERAPALARQAAGTTTTVEQPASPPGCNLNQHRAIEPAVRGGQERLRRAVARLDAFIAAPADPANRAVHDALDRHFHSTDPAVVARVRTRLETIRTDMTSRDPFTVECHDASDTTCGSAGAYVQAEDTLVFCPTFFTGSADWRIGALIHEMAHALTGLGISDRAYNTDRLLPYLSTAEALDNAESYEMLARELESGRAVRGSPPSDEIDNCSKSTEPLIKEAIAHAQRWNRDAETVANDQRPGMLAGNAGLFTTHLGDATPGTRGAARRVFSNVVGRLKSSIDVRCDNEAAPECTNTRRAYKGSASNVLRGLGTGAKFGLLFGGAGGLGGGIGAVAGGAGVLAGLGVLGLGLLGGLVLGGLIGLIAGAVTRHPVVHVCPNWASLPTVEDRTESLLAAIYESYADLDPQHSRRYAALARAIHVTWWTAPPPV